MKNLASLKSLFYIPDMIHEEKGACPHPADMCLTNFFLFIISWTFSNIFFAWSQLTWTSLNLPAFIFSTSSFVYLNSHFQVLSRFLSSTKTWCLNRSGEIPSGRFLSNLSILHLTGCMKSYSYAQHDWHIMQCRKSPSKYMCMNSGGWVMSVTQTGWKWRGSGREGRRLCLGWWSINKINPIF